MDSGDGHRDASHARRAGGAERPAADQQHAARRHRRHRACDDAGGHSPDISSTLRLGGVFHETRPHPVENTSEPLGLRDLLTLTKVRVNSLVVATTVGGYYMAASG